MPGRHASAHNPPPARGLRGIVVGVVAAVAILTAGIVVAPRVLSSADGCSGSAHLRVVADPTIASAIRDRVDELTAEDEYSASGTCTTVSITEGDDAAGSAAINDGTADLWVPRSQTWSTVSINAESVENLGSLAVSPVVVVAPRPVASAMGWPDVEFSWSAVLSGDADAVLTDPVSTPEGRATLAAVQSIVGADADADRTQLVRALTQVARNTTGTITDAFTASTESKSPILTAASEQAVIRHNSSGGPSIVAIYPEEGTYAFDYPGLMSTSTSVPKPVVQAFVNEIGSEASAHAIGAAGLRTADGTAGDSAGVVDGTSRTMPNLLPDPEPEVLSGVMRQWSALAIDMRMLSVIDVSGSMRAQVDDTGATRIELTRDAAKSALQILPPSASIGMWAFSIEQDPPNDHIELVSVGPLDDTVDGSSRHEALAAAADSLPDRTQGGTGLYDTALAAFQHMRSTYQEGSVNSVVLMTDGRNEDDPDSISLETLLNTLRAQFDPAKPIPIITIGISEDADMDALQQISEATGTTAYRAEDPRDIEEVFFQAMVERQCRPNC